MGQLTEKLIGLVRPEARRDRMEVKFNVLAPLPQETAPALNNLDLPSNAAYADVASYARICVREARKLSRCNLSAAKRVPLTEAFLKSFLPIAFKYINVFAADGGVPDPEHRQLILDGFADTIRLLAESYKIIFDAAMRGRRFTLSDAFKHRERSAFRILELTRLEQRVRGLRYELLSDSGWLVVNNVFHLMRAAGQADTRHPLLENIILDREEDPKTQSIVGVFLSIHMVSKFNLLRWPTEWQANVFAYSTAVRSLVSLSEYAGGDLSRDTSISYCYDARPARIKPADPGQDLGPALVFDWSQLVKSVTADYLQLFNDRSPDHLKKIPERLITLPQNERMAFAQLQFESLTGEYQHAGSEEAVGKVADIRIFIGFRSVYALLQNIQGSSYDVGTRLDDVLAKRSAVLAEDNVGTRETVWFVQSETPRLMRIRTQETKFTTNMKIGAPAAFGVGAEGIAEPSFGVISRIFRPSATTVAVDILKLGQYVGATVTGKDAAALKQTGGATANLLAAITVSDNTGDPKLMLPPRIQLRENDPLFIAQSEGVQGITLGKLQSVTRGFYLFRFKPSAE